MKKWRYICIALIIVNILLITIMIKNNKDTSNYSPNSQDIYTKTEPHSIEEGNKICPEGLYQFVYRYKGTTSIDDFQEALYTLVMYMNSLDTELMQMDDIQLKEYYDNNKEKIERDTTIVNPENFINLVKFSEKYQQYSSYTTIKLLGDTYNDDGDYTNINMKIIFSDVDEIEFKVAVGNFGNRKGIIRFIPITEE